MFKIQLYNNLAEQGLGLFEAKDYQLSNHDNVFDPDSILLRSQKLSMDMIPPSVLAIARAGSGVNNVPVASLTEVGVPVFNTPGANANAVKELVLAGLFLSARNICNAWQYVNNIEYDGLEPDDVSQYIERGKKKFKGVELPSKVLAVIGLGAIGVKVANAAKALGMSVIGYDPSITVDSAWQLSADVKKAKSLMSAVKKADFITMHVPLTKNTKHLVNKTVLSSLKPSAVILNFARNDIVDELEIKSCLDNNKLGCYVTDFPSNILNNNEKVIALPHIGASTKEAEHNCARMAVITLKNYLEKGLIHNSVNFPEVNFTEEYDYRIAVINRNVPNMVAQVTGILAEDKLNIIDLINKSRDDIAYSLIDLDKKPEKSLLDKIKNISGVLEVRLISKAN